MALEIRRILRSDDLSAFDCGQPHLNEYFHNYAKQNTFRHRSAISWLAVEGQEIAGAMAVTIATVSPTDMAEVESLRYPAPVLRVGRLAVDVRWQAHGVGKLLLSAACRLAVAVDEQVGCLGILVDAKEKAISWYQKRNFVPLEAATGDAGHRWPVPMFLHRSRFAPHLATR